jgi:rare lipoprotein A
LRIVALALLCAVVLIALPASAGDRVMKGKAVYYSNQLRGQHMACGPRYQPDKMVAANRTLPCGTKLKVKSTTTGKIVYVTVQDRGPYGAKNTILDLSRRAARRLGFLSAGSAHVKAIVRN